MVSGLPCLASVGLRGSMSCEPTKVKPGGAISPESRGSSERTWMRAFGSQGEVDDHPRIVLTLY
jgi:hypothetical protein